MSKVVAAENQFNTATTNVGTDRTGCPNFNVRWPTGKVLPLVTPDMHIVLNLAPLHVTVRYFGIKMLAIKSDKCGEVCTFILFGVALTKLFKVL